MKTLQIRYVHLVCILVVTTFASCSKTDNSEKPADEQLKGMVDPDLVGTWEGTVNGSFGEADMTIVLESNGNMSAEGSTDLYCPMEANWEVLEGKFKATGNDKCDGTSVTFEAPFSKTELNGKWSAASGNRGRFIAEKQ